MTVPVATKHEKTPSTWSFLLQHVAALSNGGHYTSNHPNGISGADHLCNGDVTTVNPGAVRRPPVPPMNSSVPPGRTLGAAARAT